MKKNYIFLLLVVSSFVNAQVTLPHYEPFNYAVDSNLGGQGGWLNVNTGDEVVVQAGNLSYAGLQASTGNSVKFDGLGIDPQLTMAVQNSGTVYSSFILKVTDITGLTDPNGGYFFGFGTNTTTFSSTVWTKAEGADFKIGLDKNTSTANLTYSTANFTLNSEIFIVIAYDFTSNTSSMWINPSASDLGTATAPAATITAATGTNRASIDRIFLRQDSVSETPFIEIDEVRIGTTWADVTPQATASVNDNAIAGLKIYPNPLTGNTLNVSSDLFGEKTVAIYDVMGKRILSSKVVNDVVNTGSLNKGVYIVKVTQEGKTATRKLVVQ